MRTPEQIDHLSHSSINTFLRCPRQWAYAYLEGLRRPPGVALIKGSALDKAATHNLEQKIGTREDLPIDDVLEVAEDAYRADVDRNGGPSEIDWGADNYARALDSTIGLTEVHMTYHAPQIQPAHVQMNWHRPIPGTDRDVVGGLDFMEEDGTVGDVKSGNRALNQGDADTDQQPTVYSWLMDDDITFRFWRSIDTGRTRKHEVVTTTRGATDRAWFETAAQEVSAAIDAGIFPPNSQGWHCDKRYCGFYELCMSNRLPKI